MTGEWALLYGFTTLHFMTVIWGFLYLRRNPTDKKLVEASNYREDRIFLSMHHIGRLSGLMGFFGIIFANIHDIIPERFAALFVLTIAALALLPLIMLIIYWIIKIKKIPRSEWLDEKQFSDTMSGALFSAVAAIPLYTFVCVMDLLGVELNITTWIFGIFFIQLVIFSSVILSKNKQE